MNDSVMIQPSIDAHEGRVVLTLDIPGAFLHADLGDKVIMLLRGQLADLMVQVDPELYGPYPYLRKTAKGESIYAQGHVWAVEECPSLLPQIDYSFKLNPYDPCVAKKMVDDSPMTVVWHVDDLNVSHKSAAAIDSFVRYLKSKYGENLTVHTQDLHDYLGVEHDYSEKGVVKLSMMKHLDKISKISPTTLKRQD
eukprot:CCRYP_002269-RA/>CCRYP_002269-RA protein AED:0.38 eAED:0.40 QI:0/0/0/1/0/0/2/0/194